MSSLAHRFADWINPQPRDPPRRYPDAEPADIRARFPSAAADRSELLLNEAKEIFEEPQSRIDGVERRATTLQGAVAIAASVTLTGGGLLLDRGKVPDDDWRLIFAIALGVLLLLFVLAGLRAVTATTRIFAFRVPVDLSISDRAGAASDDEYRLDQAAYLLWAYARNSEIAAVKVEFLRKAAFWFRLALGVLFVLMVLLVIYAAAIDTSAPARVAADLPSR